MNTLTYKVIRCNEHPKAFGRGYVREHILIVEKALGRFLPSEAEVHHVNENRKDNRNKNLIICPDKKYHKLLHMRQRAYNACGNANWRKCVFCKKYDDHKNLFIYIKKNGNSGLVYHKKCENSYHAKRHAIKKIKLGHCR